MSGEGRGQEGSRTVGSRGLNVSSSLRSSSRRPALETLNEAEEEIPVSPWKLRMERKRKAKRTLKPTR